MRTPLIECDKCEGAGRIPMPEELQDTLAALTSLSRTAGDVLKVLGAKVSQNAINNRLEELRKRGFVTRQRHGKFWLYTRKSAQQIVK